MDETKFTTKEKNKILKEVLKKTSQYYEESLQEQDLKEGEKAIGSIKSD